jgi:hypothetical protein
MSWRTQRGSRNAKHGSDKPSAMIPVQTTASERRVLRVHWRRVASTSSKHMASDATARNVMCREHLSLARASLGAPGDRFRWGEAKGRAEGSGQVRRIGEARVHGGCPHQFTGSDLARGMLER